MQLKVFTPAAVAHHIDSGWWDGSTWNSRTATSIATQPDRLALVDPANRADITDGEPKRLTWTEVDAWADELGAHLVAADVGKGDVVAVQLPNIAELAVVYLAISRIGAVITPFPIQYREHELVELCSRSEAVAFVTATTILGRSNAQAVLDLRSELPQLARVLAFGNDVPPAATELDRPPSGEATAALVSHMASITVEPNDAITICWTSGTESAPKGVLRAHGDWSSVLCTVIDVPQLTADDILLCTFPMVNAGGLGGMFGPWFSVGCTLVLHQPFDLDLFLHQIEDEGVTYTVSPPAVLTRLLLEPERLAEHDLSSLRAVGSGSAPLSPFLIEGWEDRGVEVINFFGSNEGTPLVSYRATTPDPAERAVCFPNLGADGVDSDIRTADQTTMRLIDIASGREILEPEHPGELRIKGPTIFGGYLGGSPDPFDDEGFFCTGDVFQYANEQCTLLEYVDRAKDLIIRGGINISPAEIEGLLQSHPDVAEIAAVGAPDDILGERVTVFVVPRAGRSPTLESLIDYLVDQRVAKFKLPEAMEVIAELPRNPVGKVLKRELRARCLPSETGR